MNPLRRGLAAFAANGVLLGAVALATGVLNTPVLLLAAAHAALESASQPERSSDVADRGDAVLFAFSGLSLFVVYALAAASPNATTAPIAAIWIAGIALRVLAIRTLGSAFRSSTHPTSARIHTGVYRFLEHPSELGLVLCVGAAAAVTDTTLAAVAAGVALALALSRVHLEERATRDAPLHGRSPRLLAHPRA